MASAPRSSAGSMTARSASASACVASPARSCAANWRKILSSAATFLSAAHHSALPQHLHATNYDEADSKATQQDIVVHVVDMSRVTMSASLN